MNDVNETLKDGKYKGVRRKVEVKNRWILNINNYESRAFCMNIL